jgi:hypothetical protein
MTSVLQSKLAKRAVLLFALITALAYLRTPAQAQGGCVEMCLQQEITCDEACDGNQNCLNECRAANEQCVENCIP